MPARSNCAGCARRKPATSSARTFSGFCCESFQVVFQSCLIDFGKLASFKRLKTGLDVHAQGLQLKRVFPPALPKLAQCRRGPDLSSKAGTIPFQSDFTSGGCIHGIARDEKVATSPAGDKSRTEKQAHVDRCCGC